MTNLFERLDAASVSTAVDNLLNGFEEMTYLNTFLESTGDEPPCLHITLNSMYPYSRGYTTPDPPLSLTRYQWRGLYAAWRLAIVSPDLQQILVFPKKEEPSIVPMASVKFRLQSKQSWQHTASTTYTYVRKYSKG